MLNILLQKQPRVFVHSKCTNDELRGMVTLSYFSPEPTSMDPMWWDIPWAKAGFMVYLAM